MERSTSDPLAQNRDPAKFIEVNVELGMRYMQVGDMRNAHRTLNRAYQTDASNPAVNNALAIYHKLEGDSEQAEAHYKIALLSDPNHTQSRNNYAVFLYGERRFQEALEHFQLVVKDFRYPNRFQVFENIGLCQLQLGDKGAAKQNFNRALQLNPRQAASLLQLGELAYEERNFVLGQQYLDQLNQLSRTSSPAELWLGIRLQRALGNQDKVASMALALKNLYPDSVEFKAYRDSLAEQ
jgi:type IV pilus assembly protein PilF